MREPSANGEGKVSTRGRRLRGVAAGLFGSFSLLVGGAGLVGGVAVVGGVAGASSASAMSGLASSPIMLVAGGSADTVNGYQRVDATNWSGYAQYTKAKGMFSAVEDTWRVPKVNTSERGKQYASDWVGIGGYNDGPLVQAGTAESNDNGKAGYNAWTEVLPESEVPFSLRIRPGDLIKTVVRESSKDIWVMTVNDLTTKKSASRTVHYSASGKSAEAIHERPSVNGLLTKLATTDNVPFVPGNFSTAHPGALKWKPLMSSVRGANVAEIVMVNRKGTVTFASPSVPDSADKGFAVADGSRPPSAP